MKTFRHAADLKDLHFEPSGGESKTIPDQAMSMREILHRYTTGQSMSVNTNVPVYEENRPLYDVRRKHNIDLAEDRYANERRLDEIQVKHAEIVDAENKRRAAARKQQQPQQQAGQPANVAAQSDPKTETK